MQTLLQFYVSTMAAAPLPACLHHSRHMHRVRITGVPVTTTENSKVQLIGRKDRQTPPSASIK